MVSKTTRRSRGTVCVGVWVLHSPNSYCPQSQLQVQFLPCALTAECPNNLIPLGPWPIAGPSIFPPLFQEKQRWRQVYIYWRQFGWLKFYWARVASSVVTERPAQINTDSCLDSTFCHLTRCYNQSCEAGMQLNKGRTNIASTFSVCIDSKWFWIISQDKVLIISIGNVQLESSLLCIWMALYINVMNVLHSSIFGSIDKYPSPEQNELPERDCWQHLPVQ